MSNSSTMRAVVFMGPGKVAIQDRPMPTIQEPTDIIVRVGKVVWPNPRLGDLR